MWPQFATIVPRLLSRRSALQKFAQLAVAGPLAAAFNAVTSGAATAFAGQAAESGSVNANESIGVGTRSPIRACIFVFYYGGPSHLDTWDLKPDAPSEIRGPFQPIQTTLPGLQICEHLPHLAQVAHHLTVIRSVHHRMRNHDSANVQVLAGREPVAGDLEIIDDSNAWPCLGATINFALPADSRLLTSVSLPFAINNVGRAPGQAAGFLGPRYAQFEISGDVDTLRFQADGLELPRGLAPQDLRRRELLLRAIETGSAADHSATNDHSQRQSATRVTGARVTGARVTGLQSLQNRAFELIQSQAIRDAIDIDQESISTRLKYGWQPAADDTPREVIIGGTGAEKARGRRLRGPSLLVARRLVEAGVPFVTVYDYRQQGQNWDSHTDNFNQLQHHLLPSADRGLAALIQDLNDRGLLDSTLVVAMGEFGRTPRINGSAGRDHWPDCFSAVLAGGGVRGGAVFGSSDKQAAFPNSDPVTPADIAASILWRFGISSESEVRDPLGRPFKLSEGTPLRQLFA